LVVCRFRRIAGVDVSQEAERLAEGVAVVGVGLDRTLNARDELLQLVVVGRRRQGQTLRITRIGWKLHVVSERQHADLPRAHACNTSTNCA